MVLRGLEWAIIDSCHVWFDGWLIGCHAALIWSFPICIRKSLPNMCCGPLTSRFHHFFCCFFLLSASPSRARADTRSVSVMVKGLEYKKSERRGSAKWFPSEKLLPQTQTHTPSREHHTPMRTCSLWTHSHTHTVGRGGGRRGLGVVKGAVCYVMEGRNGFALSDRAVTTALFHVWFNCLSPDRPIHQWL